MRNILFLSLLLATSIALGQKKGITLEDIWKKGTFNAEYVQGFRSMADGEHYTEIENGGLYKKSFATGETVEEFEFYRELKFEEQPLRVSSFEFNQAEDKMLLFTEPERIYRHSALYKVFVYDIKKASLSLVSKEKILHATFSPLSDKVAYVQNNNLYYIDLSNNETERITTDGSKEIINGNCDWVYEEEFGFTKAFEWSPNGEYLAFYRFDQNAVPEFTMMYFNELYPTKYEFKYPKAGEVNSKIKIGVHNIAKHRSEYLEYEEEYIPRIKWTNYDNKLIIYTLNRHQNILRFYAVNPKTLSGKKIYEEGNKYYIDINDEITFLEKQNAFLFTSEKSGYNHIYCFDIDKQEMIQITSGDWEVTKLHGINESTGLIYYTSTEQSPLERNLFCINLEGKEKVGLTPEKGWHEVSFSHQFKYFVDDYSNAFVPSIFTMKNNRANLLRVLKDNIDLRKKMQEFDLQPMQLMEVPIGNDLKLNAWMIKPKMEDGKKYPLIMFQYSGPGSQQVANKFSGGNFWWYQMLAQQGYIVACVDGRGTGFRGEEFKKMTYLQLGKYESDDQIAAAKYFGGLDYVDENRIGIWGWSYGGYMSSICIAKGADVFKSAIAVAPVTNWRYYDNIYTERYMRTPQENSSGYDDNSPINMVNKIKGNYLLIHGSGDDNVHYQNTMEMINAMIAADISFDSEIYPNRNHGIFGGNTRYHLYKRMTDFWLEKL